MTADTVRARRTDRRGGLPTPLADPGCGARRRVHGPHRLDGGQRGRPADRSRLPRLVGRAGVDSERLPAGDLGRADPRRPARRPLRPAHDVPDRHDAASSSPRRCAGWRRTRACSSRPGSIQGGFAAMMLPQGFGVLRETFPEDERQKAFALFGPVIGLSAVFGPLIGGSLVDWNLFGSGWRLVFLVNIPIGVAAVLAGLRLLPHSERDRTIRLDLGRQRARRAVRRAPGVPADRGTRSRLAVVDLRVDGARRGAPRRLRLAPAPPRPPRTRPAGDPQRVRPPRLLRRAGVRRAVLRRPRRHAAVLDAVPADRAAVHADPRRAVHGAAVGRPGRRLGAVRRTARAEVRPTDHPGRCARLRARLGRWWRSRPAVTTNSASSG